MGACGSFTWLILCSSGYRNELDGRKKDYAGLCKRELVTLFILSAGFLAIIMALMSRERYVYFWDYGSYWYKTMQFQNSLLMDPMEGLKGLVFSIENDEYNNLACAVIALPLKMFGNGYFAFVILNVFMFYIPNAFLMAYTI